MTDLNECKQTLHINALAQHGVMERPQQSEVCGRRLELKKILTACLLKAILSDMTFKGRSK